MRLDKAEAAVEAERRTVQSLERQVREGRTAAEEGRGATAAALELRVKLDAADREIATLSSRLHELSLHGSHPAAAVASPKGKEGDMLVAVRAAEARAEAADAAAHDLRSQCDAVAHLMTKLMDENSELAARLNRLSDETARLQAALLASAARDADVAATPVQDMHTPQRAISLTGPGQVSTPQSSIPLEGQYVQQYGSPFGATLQPQSSVTDSDIASVGPYTRSTVRRERKATGRGYSFWQWVAGADIADSVDEE
jgi:hypothetical protein